jgi:hypothetical protein
MPNRYLSPGSIIELDDVIVKYKEKTGMDISLSQAIAVMYCAWEREILKGDDKQ